VLVSLLEPMRAVAIETGRRLVATDLLDNADDVFHLTWMDVAAYLLGYWDGDGARALVTHRVDQRVVWELANPPDTLVLDEDDSPTVLPDTLPTPADAGSHGPDLAGVPASAGRASGPARVIHHPDEGYRLQPGDVLVAPSTDPGWTPLFLRASAIVMEVGGYVSHGAIVAREYGIPAVVNIPGVLTRVRDGQVLQVDGDVGRVTLID
jgi:phosphohistidine swiveling domain-containing protein